MENNTRCSQNRYLLDQNTKLRAKSRVRKMQNSRLYGTHTRRMQSRRTADDMDRSKEAMGKNRPKMDQTIERRRHLSKYTDVETPHNREKKTRNRTPMAHPDNRINIHDMETKMRKSHWQRRRRMGTQQRNGQSGMEKSNHSETTPRPRTHKTPIWGASTTESNRPQDLDLGTSRPRITP